MTTLILEKSLMSLQRHMSEYLPQLQAAIVAIHHLQESDPNSEEFSQALADLHVSATILEPYSEGIVEAINTFTDDRINNFPTGCTHKPIALTIPITAPFASPSTTKDFAPASSANTNIHSPTTTPSNTPTAPIGPPTIASVSARH